MRCTIQYAGVPVGAVTLQPSGVSPQLLTVEPLPGATALAAPAAAAREGPPVEPPDPERREAWLRASVGLAGVVGLARDWAATAALADALELRDAFEVLIPTEHLD